MAFYYQDQVLGCESEGQWQSLSDVFKIYDHPIYIYDLNEVKKRFSLYQESLGPNSQVHYAVKANAHPEILSQIAHLNGGVDVVSQGEIQKALDCGFQPKDILFSGVGKTIKEIEFAISQKIYQINVESPQELKRIGELAKERSDQSEKVKVAFRFNPDVNPETHPYIRTGFRDNKFGMDESFVFELEMILDQFLDHIELQGVTLHIGSLIHDLSSFQEAIEKTLPLYDHFQNKYKSLKTFDVGGGLGFRYEHQNYKSDYETIKKYGQMIQNLFQKRPEIKILTEPGRMIVGRSGLLLTQVQYIKTTPFKNFAIVDTGMHHLMRPSLYSAYHHLDKLEKKGLRHQVYDVVGPICESTDVIANGRNLETLNQGDILTIFDAGAYGYSMSSNYNAHGLPQELVIK